MAAVTHVLPIHHVLLTLLLVHHNVLVHKDLKEFRVHKEHRDNKV